MSHTSYQSKLNNQILQWPYHTQKQFHIALKKHKLKTESFVGKFSTIDKEKNQDKQWLKTRLLEFNDKYKQRREYLAELEKDTKLFSSNYSLVTSANDQTKTINKRQEIFGDIIGKYLDKGYDPKEVFPKNNIFEPSILWKDEKYFEGIYRTQNPEKFRGDKTYISKIDKKLSWNQMKEKKKSLNSTTPLSSYQEAIREKREQMKREKEIRTENWILQHDVLKVKRTLNNLGNEDIDQSDYDSHIYLRTWETDCPATKNTFRFGESITPQPWFLKTKKNSLAKNFPLSLKKPTKPTSRTKISRTTENITPLMELCKEIKTGNYISKEKKIQSYCDISNKNFPEIKITNGSNWVGFVNDLQKRTDTMNLSNKVHQLKLRTGEYSIKSENLERTRDMDQLIKGINYEYSQELWNVNWELYKK